MYIYLLGGVVNTQLLPYSRIFDSLQIGIDQTNVYGLCIGFGVSKAMFWIVNGHLFDERPVSWLVLPSRPNRETFH